jgi:hypothetical protein
LFLFAKQAYPNQEVNGTVILPPLVFPAEAILFTVAWAKETRQVQKWQLALAFLTLYGAKRENLLPVGCMGHRYDLKLLFN